MATKSTLSVSKLPQFEENPFIESAIKEIQENTVKKVQYVNGSKGAENLVVNQEGEIIAQSRFIRYVEVDEEKFAKIYLSQFGAFWDLSKTAIKVLGYILNNLIPNKDIVYIDIQDALKYTGYREEKSRRRKARQRRNSMVFRNTTYYF